MHCKELQYTFLIGNTYSFRTPGVDRFGDIWIVPRQNHVLFDVMACSDVQIALAATPGGSVQDAHEVVIGGSDNTRLDLYDILLHTHTVEGSGSLVELRTLDYESCVKTC